MVNVGPEDCVILQVMMDGLRSERRLSQVEITSVVNGKCNETWLFSFFVFRCNLLAERDL